MKCWHCNAEQTDLPMGKLSYRAVCEKCSSWLHCCRNCVHYRPGLPNDCVVPDTELITDREACNFCDEFALLGTGRTKMPKSDDISKRLFGDD